MQSFMISVLNLELKLSYSIFSRVFITETAKQKLNFLLRKFFNFHFFVTNSKFTRSFLFKDLKFSKTLFSSYYN